MPRTPATTLAAVPPVHSALPKRIEEDAHGGRARQSCRPPPRRTGMGSAASAAASNAVAVSSARPMDELYGEALPYAIDDAIPLVITVHDMATAAAAAAPRPPPCRTLCRGSPRTTRRAPPTRRSRSVSPAGRPRQDRFCARRTSYRWCSPPRARYSPPTPRRTGWCAGSFVGGIDAAANSVGPRGDAPWRIDREIDREIGRERG